MKSLSSALQGRRYALGIIAVLWGFITPATAAQLTVTVTHEFSLARPAETITVPWAQVASALPGAHMYQLVVKDATGRALPYQVTNNDHNARDPKDIGLTYGELIFQHDFAAGEKSATFTIEKTDAVAPVFPAITAARYVPERLDDFAWENDKLGRRTFGPALAAPATPGIRKDVQISSGIDIWCKRVNYPILDRWYNKGHDHYHKDEGEGLDMYHVGASRGCGGIGIWDGQTLAVSHNFRTWKILTNGPIRAVFELTYDAWSAAGLKVSETKRFIVDAGHSLDRIESTFTLLEGTAATLPVAIGLNKTPADKKQEAQIEVVTDAPTGSLVQWIKEKTNGELGTAIIVPPESFSGFAEDAYNQLLVTKAVPGQPLVYYVGAGWSRAGEFPTRQAWLDYVAVSAARLRSPVTVHLEAKP